MKLKLVLMAITETKRSPTTEALKRIYLDYFELISVLQL